MTEEPSPSRRHIRSTAAVSVISLPLATSVCRSRSTAQRRNGASVGSVDSAILERSTRISSAAAVVNGRRSRRARTRQGPNRWTPVGRTEYLRQCVEMSLRRLTLDQIGLYYLHRIDPLVSLADQIGELADLRAEGKIRHIGLSKVTTDQIIAARRITGIAAVQNKFNLHGGDRSVLDHCTHTNTAFVAYAPLAAGRIRYEAANRPADTAAALRWLLQQSPIVAPIPGTTALQHLDDNVRAASTPTAP